MSEPPQAGNTTPMVFGIGLPGLLAAIFSAAQTSKGGKQSNHVRTAK